MSGDHKIRVGSRKSELALIQTRHVISLLKEFYPEKEFDIITMSTLGDNILDIPLPKIGEKSLFTKELEVALATGSVDFVVHSLKDLPTCLPEGMAIGAVLTREDPRDALVLQKDLEDCSLESLPNNSVIGTSSLRRTAQLAKKYPHLKVENIRGNLNTRLKKLDTLGKYQAIILAAAGLIRIGWRDRISKIISPDEILYAVGQGALAVECRENDENTKKLLEPLYDLPTTLQVTAERSFLKTLGGGCSAPVAVCTELKSVKNNEIQIKLKGAVWSLDGKDEIKEKDETNLYIKNGLRCATCPYNNNVINKQTVVEDIESLNDCRKCPVNPNSDPPSKRLKIDDIPTEILENDPHEKCPMQLPVGLDFMGKCPYLEGTLVTIHSDQNNCPVNATIENANALNFTKCPFLNDGKLISSSEADDALQKLSKSNKSENEGKLFCGLVIHKDATADGMEKARKLGERLAHNLISKGALDIMATAQSIIHGSSVITSSVSS